MTTTNITTSAPQADSGQMSLMDIVRHCNEANMAGIMFQSSTLDRLGNVMNEQNEFMNDCTLNAQSAANTAETLKWVNYGVALVSVMALPAAVLTGGASLGVSALVSGAISGASTAVDVVSGVSMFGLGVGQATAQIQMGYAQRNVQTDQGCSQNLGSQSKQSTDTMTNILQSSQSQGRTVGDLISNTARAETAFRA